MPLLCLPLTLNRQSFSGPGGAYIHTYEYNQARRQRRARHRVEGAHLLQVLAQAVGDAAQADGGPKVDREARVLGAVLGEESLEGALHRRVVEPLAQLPE